MAKVSTSDFLRQFGKMADGALKDPVTITKNGRDRFVLMPAEEYHRLVQRDRKVYRAADIPSDLLEAIARAKAPEEAHQYDDEDTEQPNGNPVAA